MGLGHLLLTREVGEEVGVSAAGLFLLILNCHTMGVGPGHSASPPHLPHWLWLLLYILNYRTSNQVVFSDDGSVI